MKFREIFQQTTLMHSTAAESKNWLIGPDMKYWSQQLNFAVCCATQGCGISREIFDSGLALPPQIRAFYKFHVYFTVRRILYQLGSIQSISALPGDPTFNRSDNHYDVASYKRSCDEFGIDSSSINQSIEAFVYCILGAQVNVRSSILGQGGRAKEA